MRSYFLNISLVLCSLAGLLHVNAAVEPEHREHRRVRAYRMAKPPTLDGVVNEPEWMAMEPATAFIQQEPNEGEPSTEKTEVRFGFDDKNLYVAIICYDSEPDKIVVTQNRRDEDLTNTDAIQLLFDTFKDGQNAFVFGTSPTGIEYDAQVSKGGRGREGLASPARAGGGGGSVGGVTQRGGASALNVNWDAAWKVESQITARGWESEMVIPFKTLRFKPGQNRTWGLNIMRNLRRRNEQSFWSPVSRAFAFDQVELAGDLEGLDLQEHRNLKVIPYGLGGFTTDYTASGSPTAGVHTGGADIKYSVTPSLTLDATFNTDFAQVEVDEEQVNLTRFDLFFPEKRPFFLENSGFFEFGTPRVNEIFFSRRIGLTATGDQVPIDAGIRLSGKVGKYDIGFLDMRTREEFGITPANNFGVLRVSREFANRTSIGFIGTDRQSLTHSGLERIYNRVYGTDANIGIGRYINLFNYYAKSDSPGLTGGDYTASSSLEWDTGIHRIDAGFTEVGPNFNPEVGFVQRVGYRRPNFGYRYTNYPEGKHLRNLLPHFQWNRWYTWGINNPLSGKEESGFEHYHFDTRWQGGGQLGLAYNRSFERLDRPFLVFPGVTIPTGSYKFHEIVLDYGTDPTAHAYLAGNTSTGQFYNGSIQSINVTGGLRKGKNLTWSGTWVRNWITLSELTLGGGQFQPAISGKSFYEDLIGFRFNWAFSPRSYVQTFTQYNNKQNQVSINARFALLSTSNTGLFIVYNTKSSTFDYTDPHETTRLIQNRALYIKYNYLFDF